MASKILGKSIDIHTGGKDLKFPHHDNEEAQSCAYFSNTNNSKYYKKWVKYWFHAGHLNISGLKMSKSLKNFITIRQALDMGSARQIRILFLLQSWHGPMNYSNDKIEEAKGKEDVLIEFFLLVNALNREYGTESCVTNTKFLPSNKNDIILLNNITFIKTQVDRMLRDNFNYVCAMKCIFELIAMVNAYVNKQLYKVSISGTEDIKCHFTKSNTEINILLINKAGNFVTKMLKIFGVIGQNELTVLGKKQQKYELYLRDVLDTISEYRFELLNEYRKRVKIKRQQRKRKNKLKESEDKPVTDMDVDTKNDDDGYEYESIVKLFGIKINKLNAQRNMTESKNDDDNASKHLIDIEYNYLRKYKNQLLNVLNVFHNNVYKIISETNENNLDEKRLCNITDELRDFILPPYGIKLETVWGINKALWKLYIDKTALYLSFAQRMTTKIDIPIKGKMSKKVKTIAVIGGGTMGYNIAAM
eukprot:311998_1